MTRAVDGILLLDKPAGITSNTALQRVKRLFRADKAGHTGSLDPLATGMLPICLGQATKVSRYLLAARKCYKVTARLGASTDTGDADGQVTGTSPVPRLATADLKKTLKGFLGLVEQTPPMYSALKHKGERLYALARRGEEIPRARRQVTIYGIDLLNYAAPLLSFQVVCSKGTYIRALVEDLGIALGTLGHVAELRRAWVEPFEGETMHPLSRLQERASQGETALDNLLLPVDRAIADWPRLELPERVCEQLVHGQSVPARAGWPESRVRLYGPTGSFLGVGEIVAGELAPRRMFPSLSSSH